jgi:hypothetical protein
MLIANITISADKNITKNELKNSSIKKPHMEYDIFISFFQFTNLPAQRLINRRSEAIISA